MLSFSWVLLQHLRLQRIGHHNAVGDQRDVAPIAQQVALADGEFPTASPAPGTGDASSAGFPDRPRPAS